MGEEADRFRLDTLAEVERLELQRRALIRAIDMVEMEKESLLEVSVRLGVETLPVADAPPEFFAICRAELARALLHVRRAGRYASRIGIEGVGELEIALAVIVKLGKQLPRRRA